MRYGLRFAVGYQVDDVAKGALGRAIREGSDQGVSFFSEGAGAVIGALYGTVVI